MAERVSTSVEKIERTQSQTRPLSVVDLGVIAYADCWAMQNRLAEAVASGTGGETLLLLEHPHTYTCGRRGGRNHILASTEELERAGVAVLDVDRGGDVTYHGPGQLVAYPIINLGFSGGAIDYHRYLRDLEEVLISLLADYAITAHRLPGFSGVWVTVRGEEKKIAATGVKVDGRGITTHGVAVNVTTDLTYFDKIIPCGITDKGVTSMRELLTLTPSLEEVKLAFGRRFAEVLGFAIV